MKEACSPHLRLSTKAKPVGPQELWPRPVGAQLAHALRSAGRRAGLLQMPPPWAPAKCPPTTSWISVNARRTRRYLLHEPGSSRMQNEMAEVGGRVSGKWRSVAKALVSRRRGRRSVRCVEHEEDAPGLRERRAHDDRRRAVGCAAAAVDDEAAVLERAPCRWPSAPRDRRVRRDRWASWAMPASCIMAAPVASASWVPDPSPACAGMAAATSTSKAPVETEMLGKASHQSDSAVAARRPSPLGRVGALQRQLGGRLVDGQPDTAVTPPRPPFRSRKPRCRRAGAITRRPSSRVSASSQAFLRPAGPAYVLRCAGQLASVQVRRSVHESRRREQYEHPREADGRRRGRKLAEKNLPQWKLEDGWIRRTYKTAAGRAR